MLFRSNRTVTPGSITAGEVSEAAISFTIKGVETTSPSAVEYTISAISETKSGWRASVGGTGWKKMDIQATNDKGEITISKKTVDAVLKNVPLGSLKIEIQFRAAETSTTGAGVAVKGSFNVDITRDGVIQQTEFSFDE